MKIDSIVFQALLLTARMKPDAPYGGINADFEHLGPEFFEHDEPELPIRKGEVVEKIGAHPNDRVKNGEWGQVIGGIIVENHIGGTKPLNMYTVIWEGHDAPVLQISDTIKKVEI